MAARRRSQFKSRTPSTPAASSSRMALTSRTVSSSGGSVFGSGGGGGVLVTPTAQDPQKTFLREKFKARCFERAAKAREKAIRGKRYLSEASSDGFDEAMDEDDEEDDDAIMHDEVYSCSCYFHSWPFRTQPLLPKLFRRIMISANRKEKHSFRISYSHEVGSSFDPDMEDVDEWEDELASSLFQN